MPRAAGIIPMVLKHTEKCVRPDCRVCGKLRALINDQFAIFVPTPPCVGDPGAQDPWASHPRLLTRPGGSQLSDAGDGSERGSVAAEGHDSKRRMSEFEQEDDDLVSLLQRSTTDGRRCMRRRRGARRKQGARTRRGAKTRRGARIYLRVEYSPWAPGSERE